MRREWEGKGLPTPHCPEVKAATVIVNKPLGYIGKRTEQRQKFCSLTLVSFN